MKPCLRDRRRAEGRLRIGALRTCHCSIPFLAALVLASVPATQASAQGRAAGPGPFRYEQVVDPGGADQITSNPGADQTIVFTADRVMPEGLRVAQPKVSDRNYTLRFSGRNAGDTAYEARTLHLGGPLSVDTSSYFGDNGILNLDFGAAPAVFETLRGANLQLSGSILRASGLTKAGADGRFDINGKAMPGVRGALRVEGGWLVLRGASTLPAITAITLDGHSTLALENDGFAQPNRLPDTLPIATGGGSVIILRGAESGAAGETLGKILVPEGGLGLLAPARGSGSAALTVSGITRADNTFLIVGGNQLGALNRVTVIEDAGLLQALTGGGGGPGSTTSSIVPWVRATQRDDLSGAAGLVAYTHKEGFRTLRPEVEYVQDANAARAADNVRCAASATLLARAKTINALLSDAQIERSRLDLGGNQLTVASGAISAGKRVVISNGTVTTGGRRPLIFAGSEVYMLGRLAGVGGLILFSDLSVNLGNAGNSLTGDYVAARGELRTIDCEAIPDSVTMRLHRDGSLCIDATESIGALAGNGTVRLLNASRSMLMIGACVGSANQVTLGQGGEIHPGDATAKPQIGQLRFWQQSDDQRPGSLEFQEGTLFIDLAAGGRHDALQLASSAKAVNVNGGTLRVNRLDGYAPPVGTAWDIMVGTAPASGYGFDAIVDAGGNGYRYAATPVGDKWVLKVTGAPQTIQTIGSRR